MNERRRIFLRAVAIAAPVTFGYLFAGIAAVEFSSRWAGNWADTFDQLHQIEFSKGIFLITSTAIFLFMIKLVLLYQWFSSDSEVKQMERRLSSAELGSTAGMLMHSMVHDTKNLLGVVRSGVFMIRRQSSESESVRASLCDRLDSALDRIEELNNQIIARERQVRVSRGGRHYFQLSDAFEEIGSYARLHPRLRDCQIEFRQDPDICICGNDTDFGQALLNLLLNAGDATGQKGTIWVEGRIQDDSVIISVEDNGPGIPREQRELIFDAFFTNKPQGLGLGLISVRGFCQGSGGSVRVEESSMGGARFVITLPVWDESNDGVSAASE